MEIHHAIEKLVAENDRYALLKIQQALASGCPEVKAVAYLWSGILRLRSLWLPKDEAKALDYLQKATECGNSEVMGLAHFEIGTHLRFSEKYREALFHLETSKNLGNARATESAEAVRLLIPSKDGLQKALKTGLGDSFTNRFLMRELHNEATLEIRDPNTRDRALEKFERVARSGEGPYSAAAAIMIADIALNKNRDIEKAHAYAAIALRDGDLELRTKGYLIQGYCYLNLKDFALAESAFEEALNLGTGELSAIASFELGKRHLIKLSLSEAEKLFRNALEQAPDNKEANIRFHLGLTLKTKDPAAAKEEFMFAYREGTGSVVGSAAFELGLLLRSQNPTEAFQLFEKAAEGNPKISVTANLNRISLLASGRGVSKDPNKAFEIFKTFTAEQLISMTSQHKLNLAKTLLSIEKNAEALELLAKIPPSDTQFYQSAQILMGMTYFKGSADVPANPQEAYLHFKNVCSGSNQKLVAHANYYIMHLHMLSTHPDSLRNARHHYQLSRYDGYGELYGSASYDFGVYLLKRGELVEARRCFETAVAHGIEQARAYLQDDKGDAKIEK